jgi:hypothetical protein
MKALMRSSKDGVNNFSVARFVASGKKPDADDLIRNL